MGLAGPAKPAAPPAADGYGLGGGSRESQACRAETSSCPPGRRCPGPSPGLRLAACSDPDRTAAVLTARLTGGARAAAGLAPVRVGPKLILAGTKQASGVSFPAAAAAPPRSAPQVQRLGYQVEIGRPTGLSRSLTCVRCLVSRLKFQLPPPGHTPGPATRRSS